MFIRRLTEFFIPKRLIVANALELAIENCLWNPDQRDDTSHRNYFMCLAVSSAQRSGLITRHASKLTKESIRRVIYPHMTFDSLLFPRITIQEEVQRSRIQYFRDRIRALRAGRETVPKGRASRL